MSEDILHKSPNKHGVKQARGGKTSVYLPDAIPEVVLKKTGADNAQQRLNTNVVVEKILQEQGSTHLIVPKATVSGKFLVAERLPIDVDDYHNMALYYHERELFNKPVEELVKLSSKGSLNDLLGDYWMFKSIVGDAAVRYDNIPLYVVQRNGQKEGRIGLIDLEFFGECYDPRDLETLARIFPFHVDIIIGTASKLDLEFNKDNIKKSAESGKKYLELGYVNHLAWLQQKGVSSASADFTIPEQVQTNLVEFVQTQLTEMNKGFVTRYESSINPNFDSTKINLLSNNIVRLICRNLITQLKEQRNKFGDKPEMTGPLLVKSRSPAIMRQTLCADCVPELRKSSKNKYRDWNLTELEIVAEEILDGIMKELVAKEIIFSFYSPGYDSPKKGCWVRY